MNDSNQLFSVNDLMLFQGKLKQHMVASAKAPLIIVMCIFQVFALATVAYIEWEIIYRVFQYISGDNDYWSPGLMGLSAAIMVIGFHILAARNPANFAARFVDKVVQFLIPTYLVGIGLYIACSLFGDGLNMAFDSDIPLVIGSLPEVVGTDWISTLFEQITNPLATLAFSIGVGGLAIVNIFVAHHLLKMVTSNLEDIYGRISNAKEAVKDHSTIRQTQRKFSERQCDLGELEILDDNYIRLSIAADVLDIISDALMPHKQFIQNQKYDAPASDFLPAEPVDIKKIEKDIERIEKITQQDILNAMTINLPENHHEK